MNYEYKLNATEQLYIDRCAEILKAHGLDFVLRSAVHSIAYHAYEAGLEK